MLVNEQAVQAFKIAMHSNAHNGYDEAVSYALTATLPFLTGVKVKALEWKTERADKMNGVDTERTGFHEFGYYSITGQKGCYYASTFDNMGRMRHVGHHGFASLEAAKAAEQADYEARILSALEPYANSYPQGANLEAQPKNENGSYKEPSTRAQALEDSLVGLIADALRPFSEQAEEYDDDEEDWKKDWPSFEIGDFRRAAKAFAALSSQPVADRCKSREAMRQEVVLMIERMYSDYTWHHQLIENVMSLPASPGASDTRPTGGSDAGA